MRSFIGRVDLREELDSVLQSALAGNGSLALVSGEAGIGKTALAEIVSGRAGAAGAQIAWGRCREGEGTPPYWPWTQVIRTLDPGGAPLPPAQTAGARFALFESLSQRFADLSSEHGLLVVLDDIQWADEPSLVFLEVLAAELRRMRLLIIGLYRGGDLGSDSPLGRVLPDLLRERSTRLLALPPLSADEIEQLVVLSGPAAAGRAAQIAARSEGNPFFAIELARAARRAGEPSRLPESIRHAVRRRLERLPSASRPLLETAAVLGREFQLETLSETAAVPVAEALGGLDGALQAGLVTASSPARGVYRFEHDLVRETIYHGIASARRLELHARAGEVLAARHRTDPEPHLAEIASHFLRAAPGMPSAKVVDNAVRASDFALSRGAFEEAARLLGMAIQALPRDESGIDRRRADLLLAMTGSLDLSDQGSAALQAALELARAARRLGDAELMAKAALVGEGAFVLGPDAQLLIGICEQALTLLSETQPALRARVIAQLSIALHFIEGERRGALADQALVLADASGDTAALTAALHAHQLKPWGTRETADRLRGGDRLLDLGRETGDRRAELWGRFWRLSAYFEIGDMGRVDAEIAAYGRLAEELKDPTARWRRTLYAGARAQMAGRYDEAERCAADIQAAGLATQNRVVPVMRAALLAAVRRGQGRFEEVVELMDEANRIGPNPTVPWIRVCALALLGRPEARLEFEMLAAARPGLAARSHTWPIILVHFTEAAAALGAADHAQGLYDMMLPYPDRNAVATAGSAAVYGSFSRYLGLLAALLGNLDDAVRHHRAGIEMNRRQGALPYLAQGECELADVLLRRAAPGDRREALALFAQGRDRAAKIGMPQVAAHAAARLAALQSGSSPGAPLSSREAEVAALVAAGLTNRQIGERLHLSTRTAENHVEHIRSKLGFTSRAQIAAWAVERGLNATSDLSSAP